MENFDHGLISGSSMVGWRSSLDEEVYDNLEVEPELQDPMPPSKFHSVLPDDAVVQKVVMLNADCLTYTLVKFISFNNRTNRVLFEKALQGKVYTLDLTGIPSPKVVRQCLHSLFLLVGGNQLRRQELVHNRLLKKQKAADPDVDARMQGFEYIREHGPCSNSSGEFVIFADIETRRKDSPIHGWDRGTVKEFLRALLQGRMNAQVLTFFPLTLKDITGWVLDEVLIHVLPHVHKCALVWQGKSGIGKTPLAKTIAFVMSDYALSRDGAIGTPSMRTTKDFDFLKGEPGNKYVPLVYDDGSLHKDWMYTK